MKGSPQGRGDELISPHAPRRTFIATKGALVPLCLMLAFGCSRESASDEAKGSQAGGSGSRTTGEVQAGGNTTIATFRQAKGHVMEITKDRRETFYCGCRFDEDKAIDHASCGYRVRKNQKRASRMEVEHVVPAEAFGKSFKAWREGHPECVTKKGKRYKGRRCARKVSRLFRRMEADLYNLQPAIGEVNGDRSNYSMAEIPGEAREYGACDVEIEGRRIEPKPSIRGDIARIYLYMDEAYPKRGIVGKQRRRILRAWAAEDPVDDWERTRAKRIARIQGNVNPFVK